MNRLTWTVRVSGGKAFVLLYEKIINTWWQGQAGHAQLNAWLAEHRMGWKLATQSDRFGTYYTDDDGQWRRTDKDAGSLVFLPCSDLNAVAEAQDTLTEDQREKYISELYLLTPAPARETPEADMYVIRAADPAACVAAMLIAGLEVTT